MLVVQWEQTNFLPPPFSWYWGTHESFILSSTLLPSTWWILDIDVPSMSWQINPRSVSFEGNRIRSQSCESCGAWLNVDPSSLVVLTCRSDPDANNPWWVTRLFQSPLNSWINSLSAQQNASFAFNVFIARCHVWMLLPILDAEAAAANWTEN